MSLFPISKRLTFFGLFRICSFQGTCSLRLFNNVSLAIGDSLGTSYKSGMGIDQKIVKDTSTNKGKAKQTLNFKASLVGAADAPDLGNFEANTTFQITYL